MSAFFLYKQDVYEEIKKKHTDKKITEITKLISEMWRGADSDTKSKYEKLAEKKKAEYDQDKKNYEDKFGKIAKKSRKKKNEDSEDEKPKKKAKDTKKGK